MNVIYRYIMGSNVGMLGKLNQHKDNFVPDMNDIPLAVEIISIDLLIKLDDGKISPKHRGSMAIIYQGNYKGQKVAIKVIPDSVKNIINDEMWLFHCIQLISTANNSMVDIVKDIQVKIRNELKMDLEYNNWGLIKKDILRPFGARTVRPIHSLCDSDHFVYNYELHKTIIKCIPSLSDSKKYDIYIRIIHIYFTLQLNNVFIGDPNPGNFLYDPVGDEIIVIDYGCVIETDERFRLCIDILLYNMLYAKDTTYLVNTFCNKSQKCKVLMDQIHHILSGIEVDYSSVQIDLVVFDIDAVTGSKFAPETITVLRSISHLLLIAKKMSVKTNIRKVVEKYKPLECDISKYQPDNIKELLGL
jgi:predicted unusual protein kinase regulating ubiquinone biosynthesis (AarF/ABC1/UbiB family)